MDKSTEKSLNNPTLLSKKKDLGSKKPKNKSKLTNKPRSKSSNTNVKPKSKAKSKSKSKTKDKSEVVDDEDLIDVSNIKKERISDQPKFKYEKHTWNVIRTIIDEYLNKHQLEPFN